MKNIFKTFGVLTLIAITSIACDKDYANIDSDIATAQNYSTNKDTYPIIAYTKAINEVQSNNLNSNLLGVYNDVYGMTTASVVSQVTPSTYTPDFGYNPKLTSVILSIPYNSTSETDDDSVTTYTLDSIFSKVENSPIKLSVYKNNYFLRDVDPSSTSGDLQKYYSQQDEDFYANGTQNIGELLYVNNNFTFSSDTITVSATDDDEADETLSPRLYVDLISQTNVDATGTDTAFWEQHFFDNEDEDVLSNANNFKDFFRGIYFKAETDNGEGSMALLNFSGASIVLNYTYQSGDDDDDDSDGIPNFADVDDSGTDSDGDGINDATDVDAIEGAEDENGDGIDDNYNEAESTYTLNFIQNRINFIKNDFTISDGNETTGDDVLSLKGGSGSMAIIDLFGEDTYEEFISTYEDEDGNQKRLVNEANLVFYVNHDEDMVNEPDRVLLMDLKNNTPIVDYYYDSSTNTTTPLYSKIVYSPLLERDDDDKGTKYKIRLTEHINNMLLRDSTNVKLGLFVSTNVNYVNGHKVKNTSSVSDLLTNVPSSSVMSPKGTKLYGSTEAVSEDKRVQLEIYYTDPEN